MVNFLFVWFVLLFNISCVFFFVGLKIKWDEFVFRGCKGIILCCWIGCLNCKEVWKCDNERR